MSADTNRADIRFEFTLIIPSTLAPHDSHFNGKVTQELFAELEGLPEPESPPFLGLGLFGLGRRRGSKNSFTSPKRGSPSPSRSGSPRPLSTSHSPLLAAGSLSITRQEDEEPRVPSYEESQADPLGQSVQEAKDEEWITGTYDTVKSIMVMHNPNPTGSFSDLDMRHNGFVQGIGLWDLKIFSDVVSLCKGRC